MTFPPLLLGLPFGTFVTALLVSGWVAHTRPLSADGRRIADAAERAGLTQGAFSLRIAGGALLVLTLLSVWLGSRLGAPLVAFALVPLAVGATALGSQLLVARTLTRASCRQLASSGRDQKASLLSRSALAATLALEGASGLCVLWTFVAAERSLGPKLALQLSFVAAATIAVLGVVMGRTAAALLQTSVRLERRSSNALGDGARASHVPGSSEVTRTPHAGSLAEVVATTFGRSVASAATLLSLSSLGHALLLAHTLVLTNEASSDAALYPHLLRSLGLLALLFGGWVVRSSERETPGWSWGRGTLVTFVLLVAGAWSLSQNLEDPLSRLLPGGASLFVAGVGAILLVAQLTTNSNSLFSPAGRSTGSVDGDGSRALRSELVCGGALAILGLLFFVSLELARGENAVPEALLPALFIACLLSLVSVLHVFRSASEIAFGSELSAHLTASNEARALGVNEGMTPPPRLLTGYWPLALLLGFEALQLSNTSNGSLALRGLGGLFGVTALLLALAESVRAGAALRAAARQLVVDQDATETASTAPSFGAVLDLGQSAVRRGFWAPLVFVLGASALWLTLRALFPQLGFDAMASGFAAGALLVSSVLSWLGRDEAPVGLPGSPFHGHTSFALPLALAFVTLLTAGSQLL